MYATDTLSRYPVSTPDEDDRNSCDELCIAVVSIATVCLSDIMITMSEFQEKIQQDVQYQTLLTTVRNKSFASNEIIVDSILMTKIYLRKWKPKVYDPSIM